MAGPSLSGYKARYVSAMDCAVGSATLPQGSLYAVAATGCAVIEVHWMRSGAAAGQNVKMQRVTSLGTPGTTGAISKFDDDASAAQCNPVATHTVAPGFGDRLHGYRPPTSASTGFIWTFHDTPVEIPIGTANGMCLLPVAASGPADVTWVWEE